MGQVRLLPMLLNRRLQVVGVSDSDHALAAAVAQGFGTQAFHDLDELLALPGLDVLWVATPTGAHKATIEAAAGSGVKLVGVEKPVCADPADIQACYRAVSEAPAPKKLFCSFQRRFDPHFQAAARAVRDGRIGRPLSVHVVFRDHPMPSIEFLRAGGDLFHDLAVHDIDYVCSVIGGEIVEVCAFACSSDAELARYGVLDNATCVALFDNGVRMTMDLSRGSRYGYDQRVEFFGTEGVAAVENVPAASAHVANREGFHRSTAVGWFHERFSAAFAAEVDEIVRILDGASAPQVSAQAACRTTIVAEAMRLSAVERAPVRIAYDPSAPGRARYTCR
jgi:myo-inositol 2-dehydrogenase/D-chiro-inositol 1-dehydrogenase